MSRTKHFFPWTAAAALVSLLAAGPIAAAEGGPDPGNQGSPPPQIDSYLPFPAAWDQPITIYGSHLLPWQDPSILGHTQPAVSKSVLQKPVEILSRNKIVEIEPSGSSQPSGPGPEGPEPVLKVGSVGKKAHFVIPASDIESWTPTEIRIKKLSGGHAGAYWIAVYQNGKRVSNRNRTLFFPETDPNMVHTIAPEYPSDPEEEEEEIKLTIDYPAVEEPSQLQAYILSYNPTVVGAGDEVMISGALGIQGNRRLYFGSGNKPLGRIEQQWIKEWLPNKVRFENGFLPTGVYWVAVFEGLDLISNLVWSLQVTEDPPPSPPPSGNGSNQIITGFEKLPLLNPGGSNLDPGSKSGLQQNPVAPGAGFPVKPLSIQRRMQPPSRVKSLQPNAEAVRSPSQAPTGRTLKTKNLEKQRQPASKPTKTPPMAPVPEKTSDDRTLQPTEKHPKMQLQQVR
ncbi:MAG: hypothetical protein JRG95_20245 [Deltaproteobacteria bacterium]|nr:hypothetical protein [Deltaproteobacteria bacterium]